MQHSMTYVEVARHRPTHGVQQQGLPGLSAINAIIERLPRKSLINSLEDEYEEDYPVIDVKVLKEVGYDVLPHTKRPVWVVGGFAFFRRYNDDWNPAVIYGERRGNNNYISWQMPIETHSLLRLSDLICSKDLKMITRHDLEDIIS